MIYYNPKLKKFSRELRKNMTDAEQALWWKVRKRQLKGLQFYRQRIIGNYIVDFYCPKAKLIVEIDGGQHYSDGGAEEDRVRDNRMKGLGLRVLRFSDRDVIENIDGIVERIYESL